MNRGRSRARHEGEEALPPSADSPGDRVSGDGASADPLGDQIAAQRRVVDMRCGFADLASKEADAAEDRVAQARRQYDEQIAALARAQAELGKTRSAKEKARRAYRASLGAATERSQIEAAANAWLGAINRINGQVRVAQARIERKREATEALLAKVDRLSLTAEASRAMADAAIEACGAFRESLRLLERGIPNRSPEAATAPAPAAPVGFKPKPGAAAKPAATRMPAAKPAAKPKRVAAATPMPPAKPAAKPAAGATLGPAAMPTAIPKPAARTKPAPAPAPGAAELASQPKPAAAVAPKPELAPKSPTPTPPSPPSPPAPPAASAPTDASPAAPALASAPAVPVPPARAEGRLATAWLGIDLRLSDAQPIVRLLRGDRPTLSALVDRLADVDPASRRHWQLLLSSFVDALAAAAIDEAFFEFPPGDAFWGLFSPEEAREVARGLAALGFRYDGLGEFADSYVPAQRDLALAVGAAGLLPVRIRFWPKADETAALFRGVRVATDLFVAERAPALTLGEVVRILGRRAEQLTELWNDWPRVRPVLLTALGGLSPLDVVNNVRGDHN